MPDADKRDTVGVGELSATLRGDQVVVPAKQRNDGHRRWLAFALVELGQPRMSGAELVPADAHCPAGQRASMMGRGERDELRDSRGAVKVDIRSGP